MIEVFMGHKTLAFSPVSKLLSIDIEIMSLLFISQLTHAKI
jgi:hypothetical protein